MATHSPIAATAWLLGANGQPLKQVKPADFLKLMAGAKYVSANETAILVINRGHHLVDIRKDEWTGDDVRYGKR